ncbi:MAG: hypothetical protein R8J94_07225 [Acidimicrobiia bacterium]|nr:hypothetical protein [Acidimicrobiia bacterium]
MNNNPCPSPQPHLDIDLLRAAVGPGLQVAVGEQLLHFLSEPVICKN